MVDLETFFRHSNLIEGIKDEEAIQKNIEAYHYLMEQDDILNHETVKEAHRIILEDRQPEIAGKYKENNNYVNLGMEGKKLFCPPEKVEEKMEQLFQFKPSTEKEVMEWKTIMVNIHGFLDGNGRLTRLMYLVLVEKYTDDSPRIFRLEDRQEYYEECNQVEDLRIDPEIEIKEWSLEDII